MSQDEKAVEIKKTKSKKPSQKPSSKATKSTKKLTKTSLNKFAKKFNEKRKVAIQVDGEEATVTIHTHFRRSKIEEVSVQVLEIISTALQEEGIDHRQVIMNINRFYSTLLLKEFTDLPIPDIDNIQDLLTITINLHDLGIIEQLIGDGENSIGQENIDLASEVFEKSVASTGSAVSELMIDHEVRKALENRIDVDDYFSELEARGFEINEDEDLGLLPLVIDQLNEDGSYNKYMEMLTTEEIEKLNERLKILSRKEGVNFEEI